MAYMAQCLGLGRTFAASMSPWFAYCLTCRLTFSCSREISETWAGNHTEKTEKIVETLEFGGITRIHISILPIQRLTSDFALDFANFGTQLRLPFSDHLRGKGGEIKRATK